MFQQVHQQRPRTASPQDFLLLFPTDSVHLSPHRRDTSQKSSGLQVFRVSLFQYAYALFYVALLWMCGDFFRTQWQSYAGRSGNRRDATFLDQYVDADAGDKIIRLLLLLREPFQQVYQAD